MLKDLHVWLAIVTTATLLAATVEGAVRAARHRPPGRVTLATLIAVLVSAFLTATAGVALVVTGHHPKEWLHLLYAALAFGLIPFADNASNELKTNRDKGLYRLAGGVVSLLVITRLFVTGHQ